jgi:hypothetical protein
MPVSEAGIGCAYKGGDYWETADEDPETWQDGSDREPAAGGQRSHSTHPAEPGDAVTAAHVPAIEGNEGRDGGANYNDAGRDANAGRSGPPRSGYEAVEGTPRQRRQSGKLGQEQSVSYQAEERYWTDYLRIALPIAGLLLLLGVFWYWASTFIGDDDNNDPQTPVAQVVNTPITASTQTPTVSAAVTLAPVTVQPTQETEQPAATEAPDTESTATTAPEENGGETDPGGETGTFAEGDIVVVNDNDVNLRADATTDSEALTTLILGQELRVISSEPVDDGTYVWWNVADEINDLEGWIAGEFIEPPS